MDTNHVTVLTKILPSKPLGLYAEKRTRRKCVLQGGCLELDGVTVGDGDVLKSGKTYNFVGGNSQGK